MFFKRKLQSQYKYFLQTIYSLNLPSWLTCKATKMALMLVIVFCSTGYIAKTASTASTGYQINELEKTVFSLEEDIKKTEVDIAEYSSLASVQDRLENMRMVGVEKLTFYSVADAVVARR